MIKSQKKIGEILIEHGLITPEQLKYALEEQARTNKFLGAILLKKGNLKEKDLLNALSKQFNIPLVKLESKNIDWDFVKKFSAALILDHKCLPVSQDEESMTIAVSNPLDVWAIKKAEEEAGGLRLKLVLICGKDIEDAITEYKRRMRTGILKSFE
jgi:type IV pilus assembly protein PilB